MAKNGQMKMRKGMVILALMAVASCGEDQKEKDEKDGVTESGATRSKSMSSSSSKREKSLTRSERILRAEQMTTTASGLKYQVLQEGSGEHPTLLSNVKVHYVGRLMDGTVFDSSYDRGEPAVFGLHQVIKGWGEGVQLMKPGGKWRFVIPPELAYGERGAGEQIPGDSTLEFEVELLSIEE